MRDRGERQALGVHQRCSRRHAASPTRRSLTHDDVWIREMESGFMKNRIRQKSAARRRRYGFLSALLTAMFALAPASAQKPAQPAAQPAQPAATFSSRSELVLVPAIVTDRSGAHVAGLKKEDFSVLENGAEQKIATFEEIQATTAPVHRAAPGATGLFTNAAVGESEAPRRVNILLLDMVNTAFMDQAYARDQLLKYLRASV